MIPADDLSRSALRRLLRQRRRQLTPLEQRRAARALYRQLSHHPLFRRTRHLALYLANDGEIDPALLLQEAQRRGKATYLPVLNPWPRTRMVFQRVLPGERLRLNRFGIPEPRFCRARQRRPWALGLVCLPLVGFDDWGGRLGMGGGFYDRSLAYLSMRKNWHKPTLLGLAHECQRVESLALASWDVPLQATVTDRGWYAARSAAPAASAASTQELPRPGAPRDPGCSRS
jgi:5-formyltetrahydrofolate cyclo-ligase